MTEPVWCDLKLLSPIKRSELAALATLAEDAAEGSLEEGRLAFNDVNYGQIGNLDDETVEAVNLLRDQGVQFSWSWGARDGVFSSGVAIYNPDGSVETFGTNPSGRIVLTVEEVADEDAVVRARAAQALLDAVAFGIVEDVADSASEQVQAGEAADGSILTIRVPTWAWEILSGSLELDAISSAADPELRDQVRWALDALEVVDTDAEEVSS